ncbi:MAG TPA: ABC transporter permease [Tabrizicola sp.]|jgi:peptide/nickel transport system permease protein|nr:ABC transporter permease [Tabrizicola sp.]
MSFVADPAQPLRRGIGRALLRDPMGLAGLVLVATFLAMAVFAPWVAPYDPIALNVKEKFLTPSALHWAGTDHLGRDLLSRIIWGARLALGISMTSVGIAGALGLMLGLVAGYGPRWLDSLLVLVFDSMSSLPMIFFALAVITVLGPGTATLILVIVLVSFPSYARLIRTQTLTLAGADYILAEKAMGAGAGRIIFIHLLPNVVGPLVILICMDIPVVIMLEAGLSYLNLGVKPPSPSWGNILAEGYNSLRQAPHVVIVAGIPLVLATLGFTFLGEGLRDVLDPRGAGRRWG